MLIQPYLIVYLLYMVVLLAISFYVYESRRTIDEMHGMMVGMTFGMLAGLITATLFLIPTGNFLYGLIIGSIVGLVFGVPFGKLGGHLGIMEGVVAGPMGGMMGAMLGQMVRPFSIDIFIPFFTFIFLVTIIGITYAVHCRACGCTAEQQHAARKKLSHTNIVFWSVIIVVLLAVSIILPFSTQEKSTANVLSGTNVNSQSLQYTAYSPEVANDITGAAVVKSNYQEIDLRITAIAYAPNIIIAKRNIPLRINVYADEDAGCAREIIFPDFNIDKIVPAGGNTIIEITPTQAGEFNFRCSMDMVKGKLIIN